MCISKRAKRCGIFVKGEYPVHLVRSDPTPLYRFVLHSSDLLGFLEKVKKSQKKKKNVAEGGGSYTATEFLRGSFL